jgi:transcriptional regulator with XRE-family HTH domain
MIDEQHNAIYLKQWRIYADLTQEELGQRMGITGTQISRIESGKRDFDGRFLRNFKRVINAALDEHPHNTSPAKMRIRHMADALRVEPDPEKWIDTFWLHIRTLQSLSLFEEPKPRRKKLPPRSD